MGHSGGRAPQGMERDLRVLRTLFLRVPHVDFPALSVGRKTELRVPKMGAIADAYVAPTPVVAYAISPSRRDRISQLMVLTEHRQERLFEIAEKPDSLQREGFQSYDDFRRYWRERTHRPYQGLQEVEVFRVMPWGSVPVEEVGKALVQRLYGERAR